MVFPSLRAEMDPSNHRFGGGWFDITLDTDTHIYSTGHNMSSKLPSILSATEEDIQLLLAAQCHVGTKNCDKKMEPYVWKRRTDGERAGSDLLMPSHLGFFSVQVSTLLTLEKHGRSSFLLRGLLLLSRTPTTFA